MKFLIALFCFSVLINPPDYFEGDYFAAQQGMIGGNWHFAKDGTFSYSEQNCEGGRTGEGKYELRNDSVYFTFLPYPGVERKSTFDINVVGQGINYADNRWAFDFHVTDAATFEGLPFGIIALKDSSGNMLKGTQADLDGNLKAEINGYRGKVFVHAQYPGFMKVDEVLNVAGIYKIEALMIPSSVPAHIENETWNYKLLKNESEEIIFQQSYNSKEGKPEVVKTELHRVKKENTNENNGLRRSDIKNVPVIKTVADKKMPEGYFNNANEYGDGEEFYFGKNNSFNYLWNCSDCGRKSGTGIYTFTNDTLELHFKSTCRIDTLRMVNGKLPTYKKTNDSIFFLVAVVGEGELDFLTAQLSDNKGTNLRYISAGKDGNYYFGIKAGEEASFYLHLTSPGFSEEWVQLSRLQMPVQLTLTKGENSIPSWTVYKYKVPFIGKNKFELIELDEKPAGKHVTKFYRGRIG
ncbi:MAG: hypothetical protein M3R17_03645 [Bacteroidota bacterium]|nr:hypothetical protein [Bacteroidota bacterium]